MASRRNDLPPGARVNPSSGRVTLMFTIEEDGRKRRLSQNKILPTEPRSYENDYDVVMAAYLRVKAFIAQNIDRGHTVRGFWEQWTDENHYRWGRKRAPSSVATYKSQTHSFVKRYPNRPLLSITSKTIQEFMDAGGKPANLSGLNRFFSDALKADLIVEHPCRDLANESEAAERDRRIRTRPPVPTELQIADLLDVAARPPYPAGLWGWLTVAVEHGMRPGEIDAMKWEYLNGDAYTIDEQFNHRTRRFGPPKHDSFRTLRLSDVALEAIDQFRHNDSPFIFTCEQSRVREHWTHDTREHWWSECKDPLRDLVGGLTLYNATRHYWATMALNRWGVPLRKAAAMFGHKDGGLLMHRTYVRTDDEAATDVQAYLNSRPRSIDVQRRRRAA